MAKFQLYVDDNCHEGDRYLRGTYDTYEEAVAVAKEILDAPFKEGIKKGTTAEQLFSAWANLGDNPFITSSDREYVKETRANAMAMKAEMQRRIEVYGENNFDEIYKPVDLPYKHFSSSDYVRELLKELCASD